MILYTEAVLLLFVSTINLTILCYILKSLFKFKKLLLVLEIKIESVSLAIFKYHVSANDYNLLEDIFSRDILNGLKAVFSVNIFFIT